MSQFTSALDTMVESLRSCPICGCSSSQFRELDMDTVECGNCFCQWHFDWSDQGVPTITLIKAARENELGSALVNKGKPIEFWKRMADAESRLSPFRPFLKWGALIAGFIIGFGMALWILSQALRGGLVSHLSNSLHTAHNGARDLNKLALSVI